MIGRGRGKGRREKGGLEEGVSGGVEAEQDFGAEDRFEGDAGGGELLRGRASARGGSTASASAPAIHRVVRMPSPRGLEEKRPSPLPCSCTRSSPSLPLELPSRRAPLDLVLPEERLAGACAKRVGGGAEASRREGLRSRELADSCKSASVKSPKLSCQDPLEQPTLGEG